MVTTYDRPRMQRIADRAGAELNLMQSEREGALCLAFICGKQQVAMFWLAVMTELGAAEAEKLAAGHLMQAYGHSELILFPTLDVATAPMAYESAQVAANVYTAMIMDCGTGLTSDQGDALRNELATQITRELRGGLESGGTLPGYVMLSAQSLLPRSVLAAAGIDEAAVPFYTRLQVYPEHIVQFSHRSAAERLESVLWHSDRYVPEPCDPDGEDCTLGILHHGGCRRAGDIQED